MSVTMNSLLMYRHYQVEAPKEAPRCGVQPEIVHTIVNSRYHLIYVWFYNKNEFWFFPISDDGIYLDGFRWNQRSWVKAKFRIDSVKSYY